MAESTKKEGLFAKLGSFFKSLKTEFKKIQWPNKTQLFKQTVAVVVISLILGAFIALIDLGAKKLVNKTSTIDFKKTEQTSGN